MKVIAVSHGSFSKGLVESVQMLVGEQENLVAYGLYPEQTVASLTEKLEEEIKKTPKGEEILFLTDLFHGSPFNAVVSLMKDHSFLVNTSRGPLVDSMALCRALTSGKLAAAAIDVYEEEPVAKNSPLLSIPNLITTPHTAAETFEVYTSIGLHTAQAVIDTFEGKIPQNCLTL